MTLTPTEYKHRLIDKKIPEMLETFGAISIEGPKLCGKTWTMLNHANSISYIMDEKTKQKAELDVNTALKGNTPHGIDEWQEVPQIWDAVRLAVDLNPGRGQFLLTGSVSPPKNKVKHSGIGRIARIRMRPMSLFESGDSLGTVSLKKLLDGHAVTLSESDKDIQELISLVCRGGWPVNASVDLKNPLALVKEYLRSVISGDSVIDENSIRDTEKFRLFLVSLARNNATIVKKSTIHNDVQKTSEAFTAKTLSAYMQILRDMYLLEEIPGWHPQIRSKARIMSSPKRMFVDPSLAVAALDTTPEALYEDLMSFGGLFEGLCLRDLLIYAESISGKLFHYRDNSNLEVDAIIEMPGGNWGAFEIKLGGSSEEKAAKSLLRLRDKMVRDGAKEPSCLAVITGTTLAIPREDGVNVIPITLLRD